MGMEFDSSRIAEVCNSFHIISLYVVGSMARGEDDLFSDIDLVVEFDQTDDPLSQYIDAKDAFEIIFNKKVDLIENGAVKGTRFGDRIAGDRVKIYEK